jgi:thioredoxin 1
MSDQTASAEALAAYIAFVQNLESLPPDFRRSVEDQTGTIQQIVAGAREIEVQVEGNHGTIRFVRQVAFKGDRSVLVSEDPIRAELQRTSSGWRIVKAVLDDEPTTVGPAGTGTAEVTEAAFAHEVLESSLPVLVHFGAEWSGLCQELTRTLAAIAVEHPKGLTVRRVNVTRSGPLAAKYGVKAVPTLLLFESGKMRSQLVGNVPKVEIEQFLRANGVSDR